MTYKIDNYGNKVEMSHLELVSNCTPAQLVAAGYDLWDLKDVFIASGVNPDVFNDVIKNRKDIVYLGKDLDILVYDKYWGVRAAVARKGFGLDILIHDESEWVREAVVRKDYSLEILISDKHEYVRQAVAEQGYGLDILIHDKDEDVRDTARQKLAELGKQKS